MFCTLIRQSGTSNTDFFQAVLSVICGGEVAGNAALNQELSSRGGLASPYSIENQEQGIISAMTLAGRKKWFRVKVETDIIKLSAVEGWNGTDYGVEALAFASATMAQTGILIVATADALMLASPDWVTWCVGVEFRETYPMAAAGSIWAVAGLGNGPCFPKLKLGESDGYAYNVNATVQVPSTLVTGRRADNSIYLPMIPAVPYSNTTGPVGEAVGYYVSVSNPTGTLIASDDGPVWLALKTGTQLRAYMIERK